MSSRPSDFYGSKPWSLKSNNNEDLDDMFLSHGSLIKNDQDQNKRHEYDFINILRNKALSLNPKYQNYYPLEVLGAYKVVLLEGPLNWDFGYGNPETFIDQKIIDFIRGNIDYSKEIENLSNDETIKYGFKLRLNYAYLLESGIDVIEIKTNKNGKLLFNELNQDNEYVGDLKSAKDLNNKKLDELADKFYKNSETVSSKETGTKISIKNKIKELSEYYNMEFEDNLDKVYNELKEFNNKNIEEGLLSRIIYVAFVSQFDDFLKIS